MGLASLHSYSHKVVFISYSNENYMTCNSHFFYLADYRLYHHSKIISSLFEKVEKVFFPFQSTSIIKPYYLYSARPMHISSVPNHTILFILVGFCVWLPLSLLDSQFLQDKNLMFLICISKVSNSTCWYKINLCLSVYHLSPYLSLYLSVCLSSICLPICLIFLLI